MPILVVIALWTVAVVCAFRAIKGARTPQGSVAWVIFLIAMPYLAVPAYLFLGHSRVNSYIIGRRTSKDIVQGLKLIAHQYSAHGDDDDVGYPGFEVIGEVPVVSGNGMELLIDGQATFDRIFAALDAAQDYVLVQSYVIHDDVLGKAFQARLIECARRGVTVRLLYDAVGCARLPSDYLEALTGAGVHVMNAHALRGPKTRFQLNFRNHRKTIVVDGTVGFTGGLNIGDEYMGRNPKFGHWRDTHCVLHGPIVTQLQLVFSEDWHWATEEVLNEEINWRAGRAQEDLDALIVATGPADEMETGSLYFCAAISAARKRLWIASPYCVPAGDILTNLKLAAMRGVDVRIMVPEVADHMISWLAAFAYFDELLEAGVQIWRYDSGFMHQKVLVVDEAIAAVGTANLDNRSCRLNFEATAVFFEKSAARKVATMLEADFEQCFRLERRLQEQPFKVRVGAPIARLFAPLL